MSLPDPRPGLVIRYGFLWSHEADRGAEESTKDRPCTIVVATRRGPDKRIQTILAPITHSPPSDTSSSLELPRDVCQKLGLDDGRHWVRFDELNRFEWPGFDLRPLSGSKNEYVYGELPKAFFEKLRANILTRAEAKRGARLISRD